MDLQFFEAKIKDNHYFNSVNLQWFIITRNAINKMSYCTLPISAKNFVQKTSILAPHNFFVSIAIKGPVDTYIEVYSFDCSSHWKRGGWTQQRKLWYYSRALFLKRVEQDSLLKYKWPGAFWSLTGYTRKERSHNTTLQRWNATHQ